MKKVYDSNEVFETLTAMLEWIEDISHNEGYTAKNGKEYTKGRISRLLYEMERDSLLKSVNEEMGTVMEGTEITDALSIAYKMGRDARDE